MPERDPQAALPGRMIYAALAGAVVLVAAGGAFFYYATRLSQADNAAADAFQVSVTAKACEPNDITVPGGERRFEIHNASDRPVEWEILNGVLVVAERENIAPGFRQTVTARLVPGDYEITCGLLSNPRGHLHVTASKETRNAAVTVGLRDFLGPLSEYKVYLVLQSAAAVSAAEELSAAVKADNLEEARRAWRNARLAYRRIEPFADRFSDLQGAIDPVADYLEKREADPAFTGFHRIEYGLFAKNSTEGLAASADRLAADLGALKQRLGEAKLDPALLLALPGAMAERLSQGKIVKGEDRYAQSDLADIAASFEGIGKIADLLRAVVKPVDAGLEAEIDGKLDAVRTALSDLQGAEGYPPYDSVDEKTRAALSAKFQDLAAVLDRLDSVIGVS